MEVRVKKCSKIGTTPKKIWTYLTLDRALIAVIVVISGRDCMRWAPLLLALPTQNGSYGQPIPEITSFPHRDAPTLLQRRPGWIMV
jgi:hypothetical protein